MSYNDGLYRHTRSFPNGSVHAVCAADHEPWPCRAIALERAETLESIMDKIINVPRFGMFWIDGGSVVIDETVDAFTSSELKLLRDWKRHE